jgi:hypothetical protein
MTECALGGLKTVTQKDPMRGKQFVQSFFNTFGKKTLLQGKIDAIFFDLCKSLKKENPEKGLEILKYFFTYPPQDTLFSLQIKNLTIDCCAQLIEQDPEKGWQSMGSFFQDHIKKSALVLSKKDLQLECFTRLMQTTAQKAYELLPFCFIDNTEFIEQAMDKTLELAKQQRDKSEIFQVMNAIQAIAEKKRPLVARENSKKIVELAQDLCENDLKSAYELYARVRLPASTTDAIASILIEQINTYSSEDINILKNAVDVLKNIFPESKNFFLNSIQRKVTSAVLKMCEKNFFEDKGKNRELYDHILLQFREISPEIKKVVGKKRLENM